MESASGVPKFEPQQNHYKLVFIGWLQPAELFASLFFSYVHPGTLLYFLFYSDTLGGWGWTGGIKPGVDSGSLRSSEALRYIYVHIVTVSEYNICHFSNMQPPEMCVDFYLGDNLKQSAPAAWGWIHRSLGARFYEICCQGCSSSRTAIAAPEKHPPATPMNIPEANGLPTLQILRPQYRRLPLVRRESHA